MFKAKLEIIGINPFVFVPDKILHSLFKESGKDKGRIRVKGKINGNEYQQTLLRYKGEWRLYINTVMLNESPKRIGEVLDVTIQLGEEKEKVKAHPELSKALSRNKTAARVFSELSPSHQYEIVRYISTLKTEESINRNIQRAINYLLGKESFIGRKPVEYTGASYSLIISFRNISNA